MVRKLLLMLIFPACLFAQKAWVRTSDGPKKLGNATVGDSVVITAQATVDSGLFVTKTNLDSVKTNRALVNHTHAGGSDPWTYVILASDFSNSTTTASNVTNFFFTPTQANKTYVVEGFFLMRSAATTTGVRPGITWPSGLNDGAVHISAASSATAEATGHEGYATEAVVNATGTINPGRSVSGWMMATLITGASPSGNFQIRLRSEVASSAATLRAGSWIRYRVIN